MARLSRRDFIRRGATFLGGLAALPYLPVPEGFGAVPEKGVSWSKAPCRFCGTGCGVLVGVKNGKVVAVTGDPESPVNKGLLCVKGYSLAGIMYGADRLKTPLIRRRGKLVPAGWDEALQLVAERFSTTLKDRGPTAVGMYGSGQWTITDGYAALKWFKGGLSSNNLEANARLCMASAVVGLLTSFGSDEPMGCYDDFDQCDVAILWGNNMAEMHPVLFSRLLENKRLNPSVKLIDLNTRKTPTTDFCDLSVQFAPQSDLALANGIAHLLIKMGAVDQSFVQRQVVFKRGKEGIGYGLEDKFAFKDEPQPATFDEFAAFVQPYTPEKVSALSGVPVEQIKTLAELFSNPKNRVLSLWCMGVNQHSRGSWMNNLIYNLHLLTGKIGIPGSTPFSLTGQPSACGTVREVGTLAHRLPADMVVMNEEHRAKTAKIWGIAPEKINPKPGLNTVEMFRALDRGDVKTLWIQVTNPMVSMPNLDRYRKGATKDDRFIVVSDVYPTPTTEIADVVLPSAMWVEREGMFGNSERRIQHWQKAVEPPKGCMPDDWQMIEVARRMGLGHLFPADLNMGNYVRELYGEYREFTVGVGKDVPAYNDLQMTRGLRWPVVNGKETRRRYVEGEDSYVKPGEGLRFYKNKADSFKAVVWLRPYEPAAESPDSEFPFWLSTGRVLEHWHTGTMTRRVPQLHQAVPEAFVEINPQDASALGVNNGDRVRVVSRRGNLTLPCAFKGVPRGSVFIPFFDETKLVNLVTLDTYCPLSGEPDYKKCAVRLERAV